MERLIWLAVGSFVGDGRPADVLANPAVREVFLGTEDLLVGAAHARKGPWTVGRVCELFGWIHDRRRQRRRS